MELLSLDYPITKPRKVIEGWTSLIWARRYQKPGEFKLTTSLIEDTMANLPIDSMVAINEGSEIMMVHSHEITQDDKGKDQLVVSGDSFLGFMQYRIALDNYGYYNDYKTDGDGNVVEDGVHSWRLESASWNDADAALHLMISHLGTGVFNSDAGTIKPEIMPNLEIYNNDTTNRRYYLRFLPRSDLLTAVELLLQSGGNGMRSERAAETNNSKFVLYRGLDRTRDQNSNPAVILWHDQGHLLTAKYLISSKGYYNSFRIFPTKKAYTQNWVWQGETLVDPGRMGINYRDKLVDASEISSDDQNVVDSALKERMATEKAQNQRTYIVDCTVAENIPYIFGTHYNLGDILTVIGDFGIVKNAMVSEYVMTEDRNGLRASPGLTIFQ